MKAFIQRIFEKAETRDKAYTLLLYKIAETPKKTDRLKYLKSYLDYLKEEQKQPTKIGNIVCPTCGDRLDTEQEQQYCENCLEDQLQLT